MPPGRSKRARLRPHRGHAPACGAVQPSQQGEMRPVGQMSSRSITPAPASFSFATAAPTHGCAARPGTPAGSHRRNGDLHPWHPPCRHRVACSSRPATGRRGLGARWLFRRRARNAPDQVTSAGLCMGVTWPVSSQRRMASQRLCIIGHRRPSRRSARVTHHTTDAPSVRGPRPWGPPQAFPRHGGRGRLRASGVTTHHAHQRRVMEPGDRAGQSGSSDWHRRVCASSWRRSEATTRQ